MTIQPQFSHSWIGTFMFNLCAKWTKFLLHNKFIFYFLACTWGIIMTAAGFLITIVLVIVKLFMPKKITFKKYGWIYSISLGDKAWGGADLGLMFLRDTISSAEHIDAHEFGHTFQNCLLGPFFWFIVAIPSIIRYWRFMYDTDHKKPVIPYDKAWFEDAASQCGLYAINYITEESKYD